MAVHIKHRIVQSQILEYTEAIRWTTVFHTVAEQRRGFPADIPPANCAKNRSFLHELLTAKPRVHELLITT